MHRSGIRLFLLSYSIRLMLDLCSSLLCRTSFVVQRFPQQFLPKVYARSRWRGCCSHCDGLSALLEASTPACLGRYVRRLRSLARSTVLLHSVAWGDGPFSSDALVRIGGVSFSPFLHPATYFTNVSVVASRGQDRDADARIVIAWDGERRRHALAHFGMVAVRQSNDRRSGPFWTRERLLPAASSTTLPVHSTRSWFSLHTSVRHTVVFYRQNATTLPLHHFLASISLVGVASSWASNDTADSIVLVWEVVGASSVDPLAVLRDPGWNRLSSCFR